MNFEYYEKVLCLPMKSIEKGVLRTLAYRANPSNNNFCCPSWDTIQDDSGVSRDCIGNTLNMAEIAGIIESKKRGNVETGKESTEYFFHFKGIKFYKSKGKWKISKDTKQRLKQQLSEARKKVKAENLQKGKKARSAFPDKSRCQTSSISPDTWTDGKSQKSNSGLSYLQGSKGGSINPDTRPISPDSRLEVLGTNVQPSQSNTNDTTNNANELKEKDSIHDSNDLGINQDSNIQPCKEKKTVLHEKEYNPLETINQESSNDTVNQKNPSKQTLDEWLVDRFQ